MDLKHIDDKYTIYKLPKQSDEVVDSKDDNDIHFTKIQINSIGNETNILKAYLRFLLLIIGAFSFGMIVGYIAAIISDGGNILLELSKLPNKIPNYFIDHYGYESNKVDLILSVLVLLIFPLVFSKWKYKLQFKDIRNVSPLLDTLILNYGYELVSQTNNRIEYLHLPRWLFFINPLVKSKYYPNILRKLGVLRVDYDGNTIRIEGMNYHLQSLRWKLKNHYK